MAEASPRCMRRLAEELEEAGLVVAGDDALFQLLLEEIDHALRPTVHERRVATSGSIIEPRANPDAWREGTSLAIERIPIVRASVASARLFVDGLSSWLVRRLEGADEWVMFNRSTASERDLVVVASAMEATLVQRHPS